MSRRLSALAATAALVMTAQPATADPVDAYWANLTALCGKAFGGTLVQAPEGDTAFEGRALVMHVRDCSPERIRIPFVVGDDLSRTWVLTRHEDGRIELRHDHRHADGSEEDATQYGGFTPNPGNDRIKMFPADQATWDRMPNSHPSVWFMEVQDDRFIYAAVRVGTPRAYRVEFDLTREIDAPPAPWGWTD
jgi:hypothetical protein